MVKSVTNLVLISYINNNDQDRLVKTFFMRACPFYLASFKVQANLSIKTHFDMT